MSEYSICFRNGNRGACNPDCEQFQSLECESPDFEPEDVIESLGQEEAIEIMVSYSDLNPQFKQFVRNNQL